MKTTPASTSHVAPSPPDGLRDRGAGVDARVGHRCRVDGVVVGTCAEDGVKDFSTTSGCRAGVFFTGPP